MAMKPCRECSMEVSTEAAACPHCGAAAPTREKSAEWVPCPKCGSAKTQRFGAGLLGFISLASGGCLLWIPVIGWVLAPLFFIASIVFWILALVPSSKVSFKCQSCNEWFRVPKTELPGKGGEPGPEN